jgi:hypothetical protein
LFCGKYYNRLYSVAYTDIIQGAIGWSGCIVAAYWLIANAAERAPTPSVGFPGYIYPNDAICEQYKGIPCTNSPSLCCYNATNWCDANGENCFTDNGAYPVGDKPVYSDQMFNVQALTPFPNGIMWNWATIFILGIGNCTYTWFVYFFSLVQSNSFEYVLHIYKYIEQRTYFFPFSQWER